MDEPQNNDTEWKKPDKSKYHPVCFHLYKILEKANSSIGTESRLVVAWDLRGKKARRG